jgi:alkanesulfonate monooxygenase SsuD/methylene tetrahydromethanopterin reductase-like flavin-dependent oxidoreductase (luciferase family)
MAECAIMNEAAPSRHGVARAVVDEGVYSMRIGVGLPSTVPGTRGDLLVTWARRADAGPFSSLGVFDRILFDSYDPLIALAAAAVTERVRLATIVIGPLRNTILLAKSAASLDALSGGRFTLGLAVGARRDDHDAAGVDYHSRGRRLDEQLIALRPHWEDPAIGPAARSPGGPELLIGGLSDQAFARAARYADGYVHGGGPPRAFARAADKARAAWIDAGRPGMPRLWAQGYFALGQGTAAAGADYLRGYYAFTGSFAERIAEGLLTTPQAIAQFARGYADAGCDELVLFPTAASIDELDRLTDVVAAIAQTTGVHASMCRRPPSRRCGCAG